MTRYAPYCPFCKSYDVCEHTLLIVDMHWQSTEGGALAESFHEKFENASIEGVSALDPIEYFRDLVREVSELSDAECEFVNEGGPGNSTLGKAFYTSDPKQVFLLSEKFRDEPTLSK